MQSGVSTTKSRSSNSVDSKVLRTYFRAPADRTVAAKQFGGRGRRISYGYMRSFFDPRDRRISRQCPFSACVVSDVRHGSGGACKATCNCLIRSGKWLFLSSMETLSGDEHFFAKHSAEDMIETNFEGRPWGLLLQGGGGGQRTKERRQHEKRLISELQGLFESPWRARRQRQGLGKPGKASVPRDGLNAAQGRKEK